jgi:hypothetical protein
MQKEASEHSQNHVIGFWLNPCAAILVIECCKKSKHDYNHLDSENEGAPEKIILNLKCKMVSVMDSFDHRNECQGVDTVIYLNLLLYLGLNKFVPEHLRFMIICLMHCVSLQFLSQFFGVLKKIEFNNSIVEIVFKKEADVVSGEVDLELVCQIVLRWHFRLLPVVFL